MKAEIDQVAETESETLLNGGFLFERKARCQVKIEAETKNIANSIGGIRGDGQIQQQINAIVERCRKYAYNNETDEFGR